MPSKCGREGGKSILKSMETKSSMDPNTSVLGVRALQNSGFIQKCKTPNKCHESFAALVLLLSHIMNFSVKTLTEAVKAE